MVLSIVLLRWLQFRSDSERESFVRLFTEIQQAVDSKQLNPMIRTQYMRTAFQVTAWYQEPLLLSLALTRSLTQPYEKMCSSGSTGVQNGKQLERHAELLACVDHWQQLYSTCWWHLNNGVCSSCCQAFNTAVATLIQTSMMF